MEKNLVFDSKRLSLLSPNRQKAATKVIEFIAENPHTTVKEISKGTKFSEATIRYVLIDLLAIDVIESISHLDEPSLRSKGRPSQHYVLKRALIVSAPPRRFWQLSDLLISTLLEKKGEAFVTQIFQYMGEKAAQETAEQWKQNHRVPMSIITFQKKLSESLNQLGYSAVLKTEGKKVIITTQNCLFWEVSRKYEGLICNFHNAYYPTLFSLMAGHQVIAVERAMCKGRGDPRCRLEMMPA